MGRYAIQRAVRIAGFVLVGATALGFVVKSLWNLLVPGIFGWHRISFWQALGLVLLSKILFGGFGPRHHRGEGGWRRRMKERMEQMTPEERERFRKGIGCRPGGFSAATESQV